MPSPSQIQFILERQRARWYKLIDHPVQLDLVRAVDNGVRFPVVPAGRRSGKTERAKRFLAKRSMFYSGKKYFAGAPTFSQAKKIWWDDLKALSLSVMHVKRPSETDLTIFFPNGTELTVLGFDQPQRFEGIPWDGGVIDEIADVKEDAVSLNILPALNTVNPLNPEYRAFCWFIGVPEGLGHYSDMAELGMRYPENPDWKTFHWKSSEILPADVIEAAKRIMSAKQFRQEYEASFETAGGRIYEDYGQANWTDTEAGRYEELHWMHDQNYTPLSSAIAVMRNNVPHIVDEIVLESAVSRQAAEEFVDKYERHQNKTVWIYGDPHGRAGEKHGHKSDYQEIEEVLTNHGWRWRRCVRPKAPGIKDRQNAVRAKIKNALGQISFYINPKKAEWAHKGIRDVQLKQGSTFLEDDKNKYQHITTAIGYYVDWYWPVGITATVGGRTIGNY
jgi:hypothetical protein